MLSSACVIALSGLIALGQATPFELQRRGCGNNCARAVIASAYPARPTMADCSSFLAVTVTPSTVTFTATAATNSLTETTTRVVTIDDYVIVTRTEIVQTATVTTTVTAPAQIVTVQKRAPTANTIPSYASSCKDTAAYVEACSCIGVFPYTVTAPAPSVTVSATATQTLLETAISFVTTTLTATVVEEAIATETSFTTVPPVPTQVVVNGRFTAPIESAWLTRNTGETMTISREEITPGQPSTDPHYLRLTYPQTDVTSNGVSGSVFLTQRIARVEPSTSYEIAYSWKYNNGVFGFCQSFFFYTPNPTNADFPGQHPDYLGTMVAQTSAAGNNQWQRRSTVVATGPNDVKGSVAFVLSCQFSYNMEMVVLVDDITMTKVS